MNKIASFFLKDIEIKQYLATLKKFLIASLVSSLPALFDGGGFYIPVIFGCFIVYQFYKEKQRIKYLVYLLPFIFLIIFFTSGGAFIINHGLVDKDNTLGTILTGLWASYVVLFSIWALFKVRLHLSYFIALTILIPIPYLLGLYEAQESYAIFFFLFWNVCISLVLSAVFHR